MKRRSFLTIASSAPLGLCASASAYETEEPVATLERALAQWQEHESAEHCGNFESREGRLRLEVALIDDSDKTTEEIVQTADGEETRYTFEGERLPRWLLPSDGIIKRFRFFWDSKEIPIPKRFWNDFGGCRIHRCSIDRQSIPRDLEEDFDLYHKNLSAPEVILSADGGTALIEWKIIDTSACCGHRATMRWMISKNGHIMRHRHTTPNPC